MTTRVPPKSIEALNFEKIVNAIKTDLINRDANLQEVLQVQSETTVKLIEAFAYRELHLRQRINQGVQATMITLATGPDLDNLAIPERLIITPADTTKTPPVSAIMESDEDYRKRALLFPESFSTAGPRQGYIYHGLSADSTVLDVMPTSPSNGVVDIKLMSKTGVANAALVAKVKTVLSDEKIRPLATQLIVSSAAKVDYTIKATIKARAQPQASIALEAAKRDVKKYVDGRFKIGQSIYLSGIYAALHQDEIEKVTITSPAADVVITKAQFANCTVIEISLSN